MTLRLACDVVVAGAGFSGTLTALALRSRGLDVVLLERGHHPRFAIGESSTPLANLVLEQLCDTYGLASVRALTNWGRWQRDRSDLRCGLKRGFSFFHHIPGQPFTDDASHRAQTLVAASPADAVADTHWHRADVDHWLVREAERAGVRYFDHTSIEAVNEDADAIVVAGQRSGTPVQVRAHFLVDASGPRGLAAHVLGVAEAPLRWLPPTAALFAHFEGVARWADVAPPDTARPLPYPVDAAALHHVFPGGWIWVLRFDDGLVSAGAALQRELADEIGAHDAAAAWPRLLQRLPAVQRQFAGAHAVTPFRHLPSLAYRAARLHGRRWALLPSAAGVVDPLLSTGFPLTLLGVQRLSAALVSSLGDGGPLGDGGSLDAMLDAYEAVSLRELDATERLVGALYAHLDDVEVFRRLTLLYFAAASYAESARRLGRPDLAPGFLLCDDPRFNDPARACAEAALARPTGAARTALLVDIDRVVERYDVAGLGDTTRAHWHPVRADDLRASRHKLQASESEIEALLVRCGLQPPAPAGSATPWRPLQALGTLCMLLVLTAALACTRQPTLTDAEYRDAVVAFHTGVAAMQTSQEVLAREQLDRVTQLAPHEPAGWANLGLLLLRQQELDAALERLARAETLAPDQPAVQRLLALARGRQGDLEAAVGHWRRALANDAADPVAAYALALDLERAGGEDRERDALHTMQALADRTGNLAALVETTRLAAKLGDREALSQAVGALDTAARDWPDDIRARLATVRDAAAADPASAGRPVAFLKNFLLRLPAYRQAVADVSTPREEVGEPLYAFVVLPNPAPRAAPADTALRFTPTPLVADAPPDAPASSAVWVGAVSLTGDGMPVPVTFDGTNIRVTADDATRVLAVAGGRATVAGPADAAPRLLAADFTYDFRTDLVTAGPAGLRVLVQDEQGGFGDVTVAAGVPASLQSAAIAGLWAADLDLDGDLDVMVAPQAAPPMLLRNNGDTTFAVQQPFAGVEAMRDFVWADLDGDGVPDATLLQADGVLRVFVNERGSSFAPQSLTAQPSSIVALAAGDAGAGGTIDVWLLAADGGLHRLGYDASAAAWRVEALAQAAGLPDALTPGRAVLLTGDLDNNAALDLLVAHPGGTAGLLREAEGGWVPLSQPLDWRVTDVADLDGDGRLDLLGLDGAGEPRRAGSSGERAYHWQVVRPRAATAFGDQRINSFGIGGEVEVRTGLHVQRRVIGAPVVHLGLGESSRAEVVRLLWPNGTLQSEFGLDGDAAVLATQRLKGSCPWLFAWDGREMRFVTDVLWRSPLGLRINAQDTADVLMTEDRVKVRGDQLAPLDGFYDLRITAELWETHFFDLASLLVVDHPADTEIWVDERFGVPPPSTDLIVTGPLQQVEAARDDTGRDVLATVAARDDAHLDFAGRGRYQGITRTHFVELQIPAGVPRGRPLWLVAQGWIHPTDSSVNVAISQGRHAAPKGLEVQAAAASGPFRTVAANIGFPAGKDKTILFDLAPFLAADGPTRVRLVTNLEIFWDRLGWADGRPDVVVTPRRLLPHAAELRYRGYSATAPAAPGTPERPRYVLDGTMPRWRDLEGYHTRFGDVRPLLLGVDDRYVIMNAGDELQLRFDAQPPVAAGAVRDFVVVTDGWEKDGDFNTTFSRTVLPLPTHDDGRYDRRPDGLENDPVYLKHPDDFAEYHTRYVTPDPVRAALRGPRRPRTP